MRAVKGWKRSAAAGMARGAMLAGLALLSACAAEHPRWMDSTALVIRPSHKQAMLAWSFGAEAPRGSLQQDAERSVAASVAAAVHTDPMPHMDNLDFKGGRFYIHTTKNQ